MNWCPWQSKVLATGGGMKDGILRVWDINREKIIQSAATDSQVKWWNVCILRLCSSCTAVLIWQTPTDFEGGSVVKGTAGFSLDVQLCYIQHCSVWLDSKAVCCFSFTTSVSTQKWLKRRWSRSQTHLIIFSLLAIIVLAKTLDVERMLRRRENSQSAGVRRGVRVRGQTSISGVWILGERGTDSQLE